ncbi:MAG: HigA family addiction module antitoxin [Acidobacteriota bacterium]|nr:HigA family addiction module antitoxin [Acidobacteriota bacterium]
MIPERRVPEHPGGILVRMFLEPLELSQRSFAEKLGMPLQRVNEIATGKRGITADTAWRFGEAFGTGPEFWMNLQANHDLAKARPSHAAANRRIGPLPAPVTRAARRSVAASRKRA